MNLEFTAEEEAFRAEVRAFLREHLPPEDVHKQSRTTSVFAEPDVPRRWQKALHDGLLADSEPSQFKVASDVSAINTEIDGIGTMAHQNAALVEETNAALALTDEQTRALTEHIGRFTFRQGHAAEEHGERRHAAAA